MRLPRSRYLIDVNALYALTARDHIHHRQMKAWFYSSTNIQWAVCAFTEAGYLRTATSPKVGGLEIAEAVEILRGLGRHPGYHYLPIDADWHSLSEPFAKRVYGTKQVTDAYLLGLAIRNGLILATFDKGIAYLAGSEHQKHLLLLGMSG